MKWWRWLAGLALFAGLIVALVFAWVFLLVLALLGVVAALVMYVISPDYRRAGRTIEGEAVRVDEPRPALTDQQLQSLDDARIWIVSYRDEFSHDESPSSYERTDTPVAVCFSAEDAEREANRRGQRFRAGWDGYDISGPVAPRRAFSGPVLQDIAAQVAAGSREPIMLRH